MTDTDKTIKNVTFATTLTANNYWLKELLKKKTLELFFHNNFWFVISNFDFLIPGGWYLIDFNAFELSYWSAGNCIQKFEMLSICLFNGALVLSPFLQLFEIDNYCNGVCVKEETRFVDLYLQGLSCVTTHAWPVALESSHVTTHAWPVTLESSHVTTHARLTTKKFMLEKFPTHNIMLCFTKVFSTKDQKVAHVDGVTREILHYLI